MTTATDKATEFRIINIPRPLHRKLQILAALKDRKIGEYTTQILSDHINRQGKINPALTN